MIFDPLRFFASPAVVENYGNAFPASQTSYCRIKSHDNEHLVGCYKKCPRCVETWQENHVRGTFLFARLCCVAVDAKRGPCVAVSAPGCNQMMNSAPPIMTVVTTHHNDIMMMMMMTVMMLMILMIIITLHPQHHQQFS